MTYKFEDLDLSKPLYAIVEFQYGAQIFKPGDEFNWRHMAIGTHMVSRLWNARQIRHTVEGNIDELPALVEAPEAPTAAGIPATLENLGMGWYNVVVEGLGPVNPTKLKGKAAAQAWAAENNYLTGAVSTD